ncbi:MAG TPA: WHG domain-containing protein [Acidimicrobiia bacterium]|nr:WHG domain-containing protein [Acidimicrobiia bacterium]
MARAGLNTEVVARAAADLLNREGNAALSLARVAAELGVQSPSLYNHVDGLDGLERAVALVGVDELAEVCRGAVMGLSGRDALGALAAAYRGFARRQPGVYGLTQVARPDDPEFGQKAARVLEPVVAVLAGFGLEGDDLIHAARTLRAALHGFALLETRHGFGLAVDIDASFHWMIETLERGLGPADREPRIGA